MMRERGRKGGRVGEEGQELFFLCKETMSYKRTKKQEMEESRVHKGGGMEGNHKERWKGGGKQRTKQGKKEAERMHE